MKPICCLIALLVSCLSAYAWSSDDPSSSIQQNADRQQEKNPRTLGPAEFTAFKTSNPPAIDGEIGETEWAGASTASPFLNSQHQRERGTTTFYLEYDAQFVYFAVVVEDAKPPIATIHGTNVSMGRDDYVTCQIDTFGTGHFQDFNRCSVNALGATSFLKAGGSSQKREWLGEFEAKGKVTANGWTVEARVPWSILRIPKSGLRDLKFNFTRSDRSNEESYAYAEPRETDSTYGVEWKGVEVPEVHTSNLWKYLASANAALGRGRAELRPSLDVRGYFNDQYELSAVLFPDFTLINRVASFIGFSHFEVLLPETRPFFQEGSGYFSGLGSIFASQRIDRFDLGFRMYGSATPSTKMGVTSTLAFDGVGTLAASVQRSLGSNQSVLVGLATVAGHDRPSNVAASAEFDAQRGPWYFSGAGAVTQDQEFGTGSSAAMYGSYNQANLNFSGGVSRIDSKFTPRLGFAPETGVQGVNGGIGYGYYLERKWLNSAGANLSYARTWQTDGRLAHDSAYLSTYGSIRQIMGAYASASTGTFDGMHESSASFDVYFPNSYTAPWSLDLSNSFYRSGGESSTLRSVSVGYTDPKSRWSVAGGLTEYIADTTAVQRYLAFSYKLSPYETLSLNYLNDQGKSNGAIQYGRKNNRGIEYFLALGDPSAERFTATIVARVVIPFR